MIVYKDIKYDTMIKIRAKEATPAPPVGTFIGPTGINIVNFCNDFNEWSKNYDGVIDVGIIIYDDLSYDFLTKEEYLAFLNNSFDIRLKRKYIEEEANKDANIRR